MQSNIIQFLNRFLTLFLLATAPSMSALAAKNALKDNPSPYLSMHSGDPVDWQLWGKDVLDRARAEGKLLYVSIGYFSCHWCHVMQRESYSDEAVGALLNKYFIPVKVDRELRPELDRRMIQFVEAVRGQAGWPLNVFITPDGYPVTGFTYLPRDSFYQVLGQLQKEWLQRKDEISEVAKEYFEQTETSEKRSTLVTVGAENRAKVADTFVSQAMTFADEMEGGFGQTMKFPSYPQFNTLMQMAARDETIDPDVSKFILLTLDSMASYHLMDHINYGFYRYSTDPDWQTPHYEKMLYDNAQLAALYLDADKLWPNRGYADVGLRTIDFMHEYLLDDEGGFNASLSAVDVNNVEGGGYLWTQAELKAALNADEFAHLKEIWSLPERSYGAFQANPLIGIGSRSEDRDINMRILNKLRKVKKTIMPVDSKRLASWNALALTALVKALDVDNSSARRKQADTQYDYIRSHFIQNSGDGALQVIRFSGQGQSAETTLEDYAQLAKAIQLYALKTANKEAQQLVKGLVKQAFAQYFRDDYWYQNNATLIPGDKGDLIIQDAVLQSPSSVLLETVFLMPQPDAGILQKARQLATRLTRDVLDTPYYYGSSIMLSYTIAPSAILKSN